MLKGRLGHWQLKGGDAQHAGGLEVKFDGRSRGRLRSGSADSSDLGVGTFYGHGELHL